MLDRLQDAWQALVAIPNLGLYLALLWLAYLAWLGSWIVLQKREPVATLSWLLGLAALPFVGLLVYQVFGPQKIKRQRLRRSRSALPDKGRRSAAVEGERSELSRVAAATCGLPPSSLDSVRLLVDGAETYAALLEDIRAARRYVHLEYYTFASDETGAMVLDTLVERARAGVKVRLLVDAMGSATTSKRFFRPLIEAGGEFCWFHPTHFGRFWTRSWANLRTHRKIAVIDGRIGYTGGINITDEENDGLHGDAFHDLHLRMQGDAVRMLHVLFAEDWMYAAGSDAVASELASTPPSDEPGPISAQVVGSGPDGDWEAIHRLLVGAIQAASRRVWLATPYFVPGQAAMMALTSAALGGLDVRLLVPKRSDNLLATLAARSYFDVLLAAGIKVHEYGPRMLHSKALLVDDDIAVIGTANFDSRSFRLNFEVAVLFDDPEIAGRLERQFKQDFSHAGRVRDERERPLFTVRLPEAVARLASPLL